MERGGAGGCCTAEWLLMLLRLRRPLSKCKLCSLLLHWLPPTMLQLAHYPAPPSGALAPSMPASLALSLPLTRSSLIRDGLLYLSYYCSGNPTCSTCHNCHRPSNTDLHRRTALLHPPPRTRSGNPVIRP
jgi:hypothetical protein